MKIKQILITITIILGISGFLSFNYVSAAKCGDVKTSVIECTTTGEDDGTPDRSPIWQLLLIGINILTAGVGIAAVGGIVYGSVLYASASDNAEQVKKGKTAIINVVLGIIAYALLYSASNFLIPGGIFN